MQTALRPLVAVAVLAAAAAAQQPNPLAYPQDTLSLGTGNLAPLGVSTNGAVAEGRVMLLFPADHLPSTGGLLVGIAVHCMSASGRLTYTSLDIDAGHTAATALASNFASNLPAPLSVLRATNYQVAYTNTQWTNILFTTPFAYDGTNSLVLDIRKIAVPQPGTTYAMATTSSPPRTDLPPMLYDYGNLGSGASTVAVGRFQDPPLQLRLLWAGIATMTLRSDRGGAYGQTFAIGQSLAVTTHATPASFYLTMIGVALNPTPLPPVAGRMYVNDTTLAAGLIDATGASTISLAIPNSLALAGVYLAFQSGVLDAVSGVPMWTCAADCFLNA